MKLTPIQAKIVVDAQFAANEPRQALAIKSGLKSHIVNYTLTRLEEAEVIKPWAFINFYRLGFQEFKLFFTLAADKRNQRERLLQSLRKDGRVIWVAELGGDYQFGISIYLRNSLEFLEFLESLAARDGCTFSKKTFAQQISFTIFRKKYLSPYNPKIGSALITATHARLEHELDEVDYDIISVLTQSAQNSHRSIAAALGLSRSTIDLRLKKLEAMGLILGYVYLIRAAMIGYLAYRLLVFVRGIVPDLSARILKFSSTHPNIVNFAQCLGAWDFEVTVEIQSASQIVQVLEQLYREFHESISDIQVLPIFSQKTSTGVSLLKRS